MNTLFHAVTRQAGLAIAALWLTLSPAHATGGQEAVSNTASSYTATGQTVNLTLQFAHATGTQEAIFSAATDVPVTASSYTATGQTVHFSLQFAPQQGTVLTVINNTGLDFINGTFNNLAQGQSVDLTFGAVTYHFVANYYGGTGNDLVLQWARNKVVSWGKNDTGQVGDNTHVNRFLPAPVLEGSLPIDKAVFKVTCGQASSVALLADGSLYAWGYNQYGQLGNGSTTPSPIVVPVAVPVDRSGVLAGKRVVSIATGYQQTLALCSDGTLAAWGYNGDGQLGTGARGFSSLPVAVVMSGVLAGKKVVAIAEGSSHSLALCSDGTLAAWGDNSFGQLGVAGVQSSLVPIAVNMNGVLAGKTVVAVAAGQVLSLVLCSDGTMAAWGYGQEGQMGNGSKNVTNYEPVAVSNSGLLAGKTVTAISAGSFHFLALCSDSTVAAWGRNDHGELGNNTTDSSALPVAVSASGVLAGKTVVGVAAGANHSMALCSDGTAAAWGNNTNGQLGNNGSGPVNSLIPVQVSQSALPASSRFLSITSGIGTSLSVVAVPSDNLPHLVAETSAGAGLVSGVSKVDFGSVVNGNSAYQTVTLRNGGTTPLTLQSASLSGSNAAEFGIIPLLPQVLNAGASVALNLSFTPAITLSHQARVTIASDDPDRPLFVFDLTGTNSLTGSLSLTATFHNAADAPATVESYSATGKTVNLNLAFAPQQGTVLTVINNKGLDFINGTFNNLAQGQPVDLTFGGVTYTFVANYYGGTGNDLVLQWANSMVVAWGYNGKGELGNNSLASSADPTPVEATGVLSKKTVIALAAGNEHTVALCSDGTLATWGYGGPGTLGNNSDADSKVPVRVDQTGVLAGKRVIAVAAGEIHCLVLCSDGTLATWGGNANGQLGNNSTIGSTAPVKVDQTGVLAGKTVVAISAGAYHNLVLCSDGTVASWGWNYYGQLGNNSKTNSLVPVLVNRAGVLSQKSVTSVVAGRDHSLALASDGTLSSWGSNFGGALGIGGSDDSSVPVAVNQAGALLGKTVVAISASMHSLALCSDNSLAAWGWNGSGELGNGTVSNSSTPLPVAVDQSGVLSGKTVDALVAGLSAGMARTTDGKLAAWGRNWANLFVPGNVGGSTSPVAVSTASLPAGARFASVASGPSASHGLAIVALPTSPRLVVKLSAGAGLTSDVSILDFGDVELHGTAHQTLTVSNTGNALLSFSGGGISGVNSSEFGISQLPVSLNAGASATVDVTFSPLTDKNKLATLTLASNDLAHPLFTLGLKGSGVAPVPAVLVANYQGVQDVPFAASKVTITGASVNISLGFAPPVGTTLTVVNNTGRDFIKGTFSNLSQGQVVTLTYNGKSYDFVANYYGGTGNDLVLQWADTVAAAWGYNGQGELGDGTVADKSMPVMVSKKGALKDKTITALAAGATHSLAICSDGSVAAWGVNSFGALGNDSTADSYVPVPVSRLGALAGKTVIAVAAGQAHSLALCSDGTVTAWGANDVGQLGTGSKDLSKVPVAVSSTGVLAGKKVIAIAAGQYHSLALCLDGTIAAWGWNIFGGLGNNSAVDSIVPVAVDASGVLAGRMVTGISAGQYHSLAVCEDGTVAAWGGNFFGALGNNSSTNSLVPVTVNASGLLAGKKPVSVAAGQFFSLALCSDGTVAGWGANFYGSLGDGTTISSATPVAVDVSGVLQGKTITHIAAGALHSQAICSDGTIAAWGYNGAGQLGVGNLVYSSSPVAVGNGVFPPGSLFVAATTGSVASHNLALLALPPLPRIVVEAPLGNPLVNGAGSLDFGTVMLGSTVRKSLAIRNTGKVLLSISTNFSGPSAAAFTNGTPGSGGAGMLAAVGPGFVGTLYFDYSPRMAGADRATLTITSNDPDTPAFSLSLTGTGLVPPNVPLAAVFNQASDVPVVANDFFAVGRTVSFKLNYAPAAGASLTVVNNTGMNPIIGVFQNLAQGQRVSLKYRGTSYYFIANYQGGDGNDLELVSIPGNYAGLVEPPAGEPMNNDTEGSLTATVAGTGAFTGKLLMSGMTYPVSGVFDDNNEAGFGPKKTSSLVLKRIGKSDLVLRLKFDPAGALTGTATQTAAGNTTAVSYLLANRGAAYRTEVPPTTLNVILPSVSTEAVDGMPSPQPSGLTTADYPQGCGSGRITISRGGAIATFATSMADGSVAVASVPVTGPTQSMPFFCLLNQTGFVSANIIPDPSKADSDVSTGDNFLHWVRGPSTSPYYRNGWPEAISTRLLGSNYTVVQGRNAIPGLQPPGLQGNAVVQLDGDSSIPAKLYPVNFGVNDLVTLPAPHPAGFAFTLVRPTGVFSGTFKDNNRLGTFKGCIYQKGSLAGGWGFYLTPVAPGPTATGFSLGARITATP